jgi:hypothetical protein
VAKLRFRIAMSLDGYTAGPDQSKENPVGMVPMLLGAGERLFEGVGDLRSLGLVRTVAAPGVTLLKFARR